MTILSGGHCAELLNHRSLAPVHLVGSALLLLFSAGLFSKDVFGHHPYPIVHTLTGRMFSPALSHKALLLLRWAESFAVTLVPQFIMGARNMIVDSLSRQDRFIGLAWILAQVLVDELGWMASVGRPLCHLPQLSSPHVFLPRV